MPSDIQELQRAFDMNVKAIDEAYDRTAKRCHLSPSSFDILYTLFAYGDGCTQKELCERCYDGKQTVNSAVHKMQRDGLLQISAGTGRNTLMPRAQSRPCSKPSTPSSNRLTKTNASCSPA